MRWNNLTFNHEDYETYCRGSAVHSSDCCGSSCCSTIASKHFECGCFTCDPSQYFLLSASLPAPFTPRSPKHSCSVTPNEIPFTAMFLEPYRFTRLSTLKYFKFFLQDRNCRPQALNFPSVNGIARMKTSLNSFRFPEWTMWFEEERSNLW